MITLFDRAAMERALTSNLEPRLHVLLKARIASLVTSDHDLTECTEFVVFEVSDTEAELVREVGFSPLVEPIDGARFGERGFQPHWAYLARHDGWYELIETYGSSFAYILFIKDAVGIDPDLLALCRRYAGQPTCG